MPELSVIAWAALAIGAMVVGMSKAALPGVNTIAIALFAAVLPAKQSTGALLVLLIVGDVFALLIHRRHARLKALIPLIPAVLVGIIAGSAFLALADNGWTKRVIGVILLVVIAVTLWRRRRGSHDADQPPAGGRVMAASYGAMGGFTTMVANAGGPVMSMYFLAMRFPMREFLGTTAYFFAGINLAKVPFSVGLGILTPHTLLIDLFLIPAVVVGAGLGKLLLGRLNQRVFDAAVVIVTILGALYLLI